MSRQPPTVHWQAAGPAPAASRRFSRDTWIMLAVVVTIFSAISWSVGFFVIGGADPAREAAAGGTAEPGQAPVPAGILAGTYGQAVTVTGANESGNDSVTIQVTLSQPQVTSELTLDTGRVVTPDHDRFVVIEGVIEGLDGIYAYNALHFRLIPADQVGQWRASRGPYEAEVTGLRPNLSSTTLSAGSRITGFLVFDVPEAMVHDAAIVLRSPLRPEGPAVAYWPLG